MRGYGWLAVPLASVPSVMLSPTATARLKLFPPKSGGSQNPAVASVAKAMNAATTTTVSLPIDNPFGSSAVLLGA